MATCVQYWKAANIPGGRLATAQFSAGMVNNVGDEISTDGFIWRWSSSDPSVIEIDETGMAVAKEDGTAVITARAASITGSVSVLVRQIPAGLAVVGGDEQTGVVAAALAVPISVKLVDAGGFVMLDQSVEFGVTSGGGSIPAGTVATDADGVTTTNWTLGTKATDEQKLTATSANKSAVFTATALPDVPTSLVPTGQAQNGFAMEALDTTIAISVFDQHGNPVPDHGVTWQVLTGDGSITASSDKTDASGNATATWTLGTPIGDQSAQADAAALGLTTFTATAGPNVIITGNVSVVSGNLSTLAATSSPRRGAARATTNEQQEFVPDEWIVTFEPSGLGAPPLGAAGYRSQAVVTNVAQSLGASIAAMNAPQSFSVTGTSPVILSARIKVDQSADWEEVGRRLRSQPGVRSVEPNRIIRRTEPIRSFAQSVIPTGESGYPLQAWHYEMIGLDQAWKLTTGSSTVMVAVVDDGIRFDHPDVGSNLDTGGYDFIDDIQLKLCAGGFTSTSGDGDGPDNDPTKPANYTWDSQQSCANPESIGGHGLHVAGTIGAVLEAESAVGVNWKVKLRPVRVLGVDGSGTSYGVAQGILYAAGLTADNGTLNGVTAPSRAHVINLSLGGPADSAIEEAVQQASAAGSLLIAAAGNSATDDPSYPAAYPEVVSVSAVGPSKELASYSNFGTTINIAAPGGNQLVDIAEGVFSTLWNFDTNSPTADLWQGTSMAAPHVSGVAALILAREPGLTAAEVRQRLENYATSIGDPQFFGKGLLNAVGSLTGGAGFQKDLYVRLVDSSTGDAVQTVQVDTDGAFRISRLPEGGSYRVYAGQDEEGDQVIGSLGRVWGALGGSPSASILQAPTSAVYDASFSVASPIESGTNSSAATGDVLPLGGYLNAFLTAGEEDWYSVTVPDGTYTFATAGQVGACGLGIQANTNLELFTDTGTPVASNDDGAGYDYCGQVTQTLSAGTYDVRVTGSTSVPFRGAEQESGFYRVFVQQ